MLVLSWQHYINGEGANLTLSIADFDMSEDLFEDPGTNCSTLHSFKIQN